MKIDYIARKVDLTEQTRQLAEKKLAKVTKYFNDILDVRLELDLERHLHVVDLSIKGKDFDVKATAQNKDLMAAIQDAVDKLEIQARRAKTRLKDHKKRAGSGPKEGSDWSLDVLEHESIGSGQPRIVERSSIPIKPMSIEEAALQNALVIVYAERWLEYGAMFAEMNPMRDDDIVYARGNNAEIDAAVIAEYPDRAVYYLSRGELTRVPPQP